MSRLHRNVAFCCLPTFLSLSTPLLADPLTALNDDFSSATTLTDWQRVRDVESWPNEQLEVLDISTTRDGWLTMIPRTNGWYEDYRGVLFFKEVSDTFVVTTRVQVSNRSATGAPGRSYSLAGLMLRAPRAITPETWTPGGERYTFLSTGAASQPGTFQYEVKTTSNEDEYPQYSQLDIINADCDCGDSIIQSARVGIYVIQMAQGAGEPWRVINRYRRPDLPTTVQVGLVAYTDWDNVSQYPPAEHNITTITHVYNQPGVPTEPDLIAQFDYVHFTTPTIPNEWIGIDLADPAVISDAELLSFLGDNVTPVAGEGEWWGIY